MDARSLGSAGGAAGSLGGGGGFGLGGGLGSSLGMFLSGLLNDQSKPYSDAMKAYNQNLGQGVNALNPFIQRGIGAGDLFSERLGDMKDPSSFLNNLIGQYQESPYNKFLQQQGQRALTNQASASGLIGSTPYQQAGIDYANKISQSGLNDWLSQVLGLNTQYLSGQQNLYNTGAGSAGQLANLYGQSAADQAKLAYGQEAGNQANMGNLLSGFGGLAGGALSLLGLI